MFRVHHGCCDGARGLPDLQMGAPRERGADAVPRGGAVPLGRSVSEQLAESVGVSRFVARAAIAATGGDINAAASNLLLSLFEPPGPLASHERGVRSLAGVPPEAARALLADCGGDADLAARVMRAEFGAAAAASGSPAECHAPLRAPAGDIECTICLLDVPGSSAGQLSCGHLFCLECLRAHVRRRARVRVRVCRRNALTLLRR